MENGWSLEKKTLITEIIQGMELAKQLRAHLNATSSVETRDMLVQSIVSSYEKALLILNRGGSTGQPQNAGISAGVPESPISINGSPGSDDFDGIVKDNQGYDEASKKRKTTPRCADQVRVSTESGLEGQYDDGYSWRKYGQKDILGTKYPRSYYRCTHRIAKTAGLQSKCRGQMKIPPFSRSNTEERTIVLMETNQSHHQKNKKRNKTIPITTVNNSNHSEPFLTSTAVQGRVQRTWTLKKRWFLPSLFLLHMDAQRVWVHLYLQPHPNQLTTHHHSR